MNSYLDFSDTGIYQMECELIALLLGVYGLWLLVRVISRSRPGLAIGKAVAFAFAFRLGASMFLAGLSIAPQLRGGDEITFQLRAMDLSSHPLLGSESLGKLTSQLHTFLFSLDYRIFEPNPTDLMLRIEMITFAVIGMTLLSAAVYELAGARPARIAAWVLALEPANVFFSSLLHKEPLMFMAEGLVAFGGATLWKRGHLGALLPMILGCLIAIATRPYVGWFLAAASAAVVLHASLTRQRGLRSLALGATVVLLVGAFIPVVWDASSKKNLQQLQESQDANAADTSANLSLERVDYSTRDKLILNMPQRVYDITFKPYLWQTGNASQRLGVLGTLVVLIALFMLAPALTQNGTQIMQRAGPLVYPALFMLMAYALSAGNAGTAFRYRTHVVALALALIVVLREHRRQEQARRAAAATPAGQMKTAPILAR